MANTTKKYYWLKLNEGFFRDKKIKKLRRIAGGDTYTIIYLKMQLLSLKTDGSLLFEGVEENFVEEIALEIDEDEENVAVTVAYLLKNNLLQEVEADHYLLPETIKSIGSESASAERVRKHRAKKKKNALPPIENNELPAPNEEVLHCNDDETKGNTEIEIETDKQTEKEIEKEIDKDKELDKQLTERDRERVEFLRELFEGWEITDYQIYFLSYLVNEKIPYDPIDGITGRDLKIYDVLQRLTMQAKADDVKYIYRWLLKVIPATDI